MQGHLLRHTPADPEALPGRIALAQRELEEAARDGDAKQLIDCAGNLVALLTAARCEAQAVSIGFNYVQLARANLTLEESAWMLHHLATAAQYRDLRLEANGLFSEALELCRKHQWRRLEHFVLHHWGRSHVEEGDLDAAERCFLESRAIRAALGDPLLTSSEKAISDLAKHRSVRNTENASHGRNSA
jgi:hypothetical protein